MTEPVPPTERDPRPRLVRVARNVRSTLILAHRAAPVMFPIILLGTLLSALVTPATLLFTSRFLDGITAHPRGVDDPRVLWPMVGLAVIALVTRSLTLFIDRASVLFAERVHMAARFAFLRHLAGSDISLLEDPGWRDRLQRARADVNWRPYGLTQTLIYIFGSTVTLASLLGALLLLDPLLLLLGLLSVVPPIALRFRINVKLYQLAWRTTRREREHDYLVNVAAEPSYAKEVRAFSLAGHVVDRAQALSRDRFKQQRGIYRKANVGDLLGGVVASAVLLVAYALITGAAVDGRLSVGNVAAVLGAFAAMTGHLGALLSSLVSVDQHAQFLDDYFAFLATEPKVRAPERPLPLPQHVGRMTLEGVAFCYPGSAQPALQGVDLELVRGKTVALVGENGAGKSTLVKLLLRFFDATEGSIKVDGIDVKDVDPRALRERVGVLFQDFANYELEVKEGLHFGRIGAPFDATRAQRALEAAHADEVVRAVNGGVRGLDSVVGRVLEGGHDLSGGQWQRLALARLIYRDADLWILDEPTANLDPEAEMQVFQELKALTADKMVVVISHRFSTVRSADEIVVLEQGRVVERGDHEALLKQGGRYAALFELQARSYR